jgi:hypothetical protein
MSQTADILRHLKRKAITPLEALDMYGCLRLAARVNELRNSGHDVKTRTITQGRKQFAQYYLPRKKS